MMSFLALTGFVAYELGGLFGPSTDEEPDADRHWTEADPDVGDSDFLASDHDDHLSDAFDISRGGMIEGFNPETDIIELEYVKALGAPDVSVSDLADGSGATISLNGVVVADIPGAHGLDPSSIVLVPV